LSHFVNTDTHALGNLPSNSPVILKLYDPRFFSHQKQTRGRPVRPWTYHAEAEAAKKRTYASNADFKQHEWPDDDDSVGWEEWYYQQTELAFWNEFWAYKRLALL
jgi:hypothetical protein